MRCTDCKTLVYPAVGLDIDGTLGQYHQHFKVFLEQYFGRPFSKLRWGGYGEFSDYLGLTKPEYREAKLAYRQGGWKRWMPMYDGAADLVRALHRQDVEVWLCTTRPWLRLDNIDPDTRHWCQRNGIEFDGMLFGEDKYAQLEQRVDIDRIVAVVDDEGSQIVTAHEMGLPYIWREHEYNYEHALGPMVRTMPELMTVLNQRIAAWKETHGWR